MYSTPITESLYGVDLRIQSKVSFNTCIECSTHLSSSTLAGSFVVLKL